MEFQEIRAFVSIIETGSFSKASRKLNLTQSAVSQSLANLERKLGEGLITRKSPVKPTLVGQELLHHSQEILAREAEFHRDLKLIKQGHLQKFFLGVDYLVNEYFCHEIINDLSSSLPELSFKIRRMPARKIIDSVLQGEFELGFGPFQKDMSRFKKIKLFEEKSFFSYT